MATLDEVRAVLAETLSLGGRAGRLAAATPLFGHLPELDSFSVVQVILALERRFGIAVADDEVTADTFATLGTLAAFVDRKRGPAAPGTSA